jgi:hypothetical protein
MICRFSCIGSTTALRPYLRHATIRRCPVDPRSEWITCLIDINPEKQNRFAPVTAHPVRHPREAMRGGIASIIIMNPIYRAEICAELRRAGEYPILLDA